MKLISSLVGSLTLWCVCLAALAEPIVIAHRGASGYLPEHTLEAAALAHALGSDYIEQDLVLSKDSVPVVLHDIHLDTTTNVAEIFPERKRTDGRYYAIDFTLAELKQLKVHERRNLSGKQVYPNRYQGNGEFSIATFSEHIELIQNLNRALNKNVGIYPEIKAPAWHLEQGYDISDIVIRALRDHKLDTTAAKVYLQCFEFEEIKRIQREFSPKVPLIQLIGYRSATTDYAYLQTTKGVRDMGQYVAGVGPAIPQLFESREGKLEASAFMLALKKHGLEVHPYTHRSDQLPEGVTSDELLGSLFKAGATGIFTDFPDQVRQFIEK